MAERYTEVTLQLTSRSAVTIQGCQIWNYTKKRIVTVVEPDCTAATMS